MAKYRKKPVVIEAWPFYGNRTDVIHLAMPGWLRAAIASDIENFHPNWDNKYTGGQLARAANTAVAIAMAHREIASAVARMELDGVLPPPQTEQAA